MFIKFLLILLVCAGLVWLVKIQGDAYVRFKKTSEETLGRIEKKQTRIDNPKTRHTESVVMYSYIVNGREYFGEDKVEYKDLWMDMREGQKLRVYYDKHNPTKSYPAILIDRRIDIAGKGEK